MTVPEEVCSDRNAVLDAAGSPAAKVKAAVMSGASGSPLQNGKAANGKGHASVEQADGEPWRKRLWLVRMPKPPEGTADQALDVQLEAYKAQGRLLTESMGVKRVQRDAVREDVRAAREALRRCRETHDAKAAVVEPLREALRSGGAASRKLRDEYSDLEARSEGELESKLAALNRRIEHETIPLAEEKALVAAIKKLGGQRQRVKEFEALTSASADSRDDLARAKAELAEHEAELKVLRAERDTQSAILSRFRDREAELDAAVQGAAAERQRIRELQNALYERICGDKLASRSRGDDFHANRRFSRAVREALAAGKVEEARAMCAGQIEAAHARLASDAAFRAKYFERWGEQRAAAGEEGGAGEAPELGRRNPVGGDSRRGALRDDPEQAAAKAQAVIAAVLQGAGAAATPAAVQAPAAESPGNGSAARHASPAPLKPPKKSAPKRDVVAAPAVEPPDNFELPEIVKLQKGGIGGGSSAADKAAERERNRLAQAEAEQRKQRRGAEKARRREKVAAEQRTKAAPAADQAEAVACGDAGAPVVEIAALAGQSADEAVAKPAAKPASKLPLPVAKAMAPPPAAKRPAANRSAMRQLRGVVKGNGLALLIAAVLAVLAISLFNSPPAVSAA